MKRRDFIKLPVLIPGLKKLLDDFTIPEVKETPPTTFDTPITSYFERAFQYPDRASSLSFSADDVPAWYAFAFEEDDIEPGEFVYVKFDGYKSVSTGPFFELSNNKYCTIEHSPPDREGRWKAYVSSAPGIIFKEVFRYG